MVNSSELISLLASCVSSAGTSAIGLAGVMNTGGSVLSEGTLIPFGLFLAGLAFTSTLVWKVASHKAATEMKIKELEKKVEKLEGLEKET
tara:strand:+ start:501 stop:770 length:270 start_codon:yes stop_codon:yes gene_type:complete